MNIDFILIQGNRYFFITMQSEISDHFIAANPGYIKIRSNGSLDFDSPNYRILDDSISTIRRCYLQRDISLRF